MVIMTKTKKIILVVIVSIAIVVTGGYLYNKKMHNNTQSTTNDSKVNGIDYSPGTEQDQKDADKKKSDLYTKETTPKTNTSGIKTINPIITYAGQYGSNIEIGAYVNVFEDSGTCKAQLKQGSVVLEKQVTAVKNVSSVDCPAMIFPTSQISSKGTWQATVSYISSTTIGTSESKSIEVK